MLTSTTRVRRELRSELLLFVHTRQALAALFVLTVGVVLSYVGSRSHAVAAVRGFEEQVARFAHQGITLEAALAAPVAVTTSGGSQTIDNPLKYDFLQLSAAVRAVEPASMAATALDFVTFLVVPLLFLFLGTRIALVDRVAGTVGFRATRQSWSTIVLAKSLVLAVAAAAAALATAGLGFLVGGAGQLFAGEVRDQVAYPLVLPESRALWAKIALTAMVGLGFGLVGYLMGALTGSSSWPLVLAALALFMAPFVVAWDPRNVMAVFGSRIYDFWGQFELRPPLPITVADAGLLVGLYAAVVLAGVLLSARRIPSMRS